MERLQMHLSNARRATEGDRINDINAINQQPYTCARTHAHVSTYRKIPFTPFTPYKFFGGFGKNELF